MIDPDFIRRHKLRGTALRLYVVLLGYKRAKATAFPSRDTLAKDLGVSVRAVDYAKAFLEERHLISWTHRKTNSGRLADEYIVGEDVSRLNRFDFSTSLPAPKGEDSVSLRETTSSPHGRQDLLPNNTKRKKTNRKNTKHKNNTPTGGVADAAPPPRGTSLSAACTTQPTPLDLSTSAPISTAFQDPTATSPLIKETSPCVSGLLPPWDEEDEEEEPIPVGGETDRLEAEDEEDDLELDEEARYMVLPDEIEPVLKVYQTVHAEMVGREFNITEAHKRAIYNTKPGSGFIVEHFRGPLLDVEFLRALFVFCRTRIGGWPEHDWELHSNDLSPLVVLRDGPVNRLIGLVHAARGVRNWKYKRLLGRLEPQGELARVISRLAQSGAVQ
jgi:Helix-turn-helix domain